MDGDIRPSARVLALATGTLGGLLAAMSVQILMAGTNIQVAAAWQGVFGSSTAQFDSALAWWLIAGTALVAGFIAAAVARFLMLSEWPLRSLRWLVGAAVVVGLVVVGGRASEPAGVGAGTYVAANLAGMAAALVSAALGAFFAARR